MNMQQIYPWAKKIHNWVMWGVVLLGSWMMASGYLMHKELEGELRIAIDMKFVRFWHNEVSQYFLVVLLLQMLTGLLMWGVPKILSRRGPSKGTMI